MEVERCNANWLSNETNFTFPIVPQSDFEFIRSECLVSKERRTNTGCRNLFVNHSRCSRQLTLQATAGCQYQCSFITIKPLYNNQRSSNCTMDIRTSLFSLSVIVPSSLSSVPSSPSITNCSVGSSWIFLRWQFPSFPPVFDYFLVDLNLSNVSQTSKEQFAVNLTEGIRPFTTSEQSFSPRLVFISLSLPLLDIVWK